MHLLGEMDRNPASDILEVEKEVSLGYSGDTLVKNPFSIGKSQLIRVCEG